ncbi:alpha/beta hydrolase [Congregibacter brevis]|uniref:Alpha/beta hydrolase n=1 Tax=Congregibacter brevis TaxID=3081201 RepID=A0ABZ0IG81_9GAMM|nr:alpha/beta hydrolase [Congregibacter sp. IMCC45268]
MKLTVPFLTTRALHAEGGGEAEYTSDVARASGGRCDLSLQTTGELEATNGAVRALAIDEALRGLDAQASRGILIYIHGYNTDLKRACRDAAVVAYRTGFVDRVLLLSWPASRAGITYRRDERRFAESMPAMLEVLDELGRESGHKNINIVAHSMGSRLVLGGIPATVDNQQFSKLILVAADVDKEAFVAALPKLRQRVTNIALLVSESDRLLLLSQTLNFGERLGQADDFMAPGVDVVDVSEFEDLGFSGHLYHLESDRVSDALRAILSDPTDH